MSARARQKAGLKGVSALRMALRKAGKVDSIMTKDIVDTLEDLAEETVSLMKAKAPRRSGDLISSITYVKSTDGLSVTVGPGIRGATTIKKRAGSVAATAAFSGGKNVGLRSSKGKKLNFAKTTQFDRFQMMKAYWIEVGTKSKEGVPRMVRNPFVAKTHDSMKHMVFKQIGDAIDRSLVKIFRQNAA